MHELADLGRVDEGLRELALFAGAGGGILGGRLLGWRTVCAVELEPYPASVLVARGLLPAFPIWDDVRTFDGRAWRGVVDVVSGGFPCQDISVAGKGAGLDGERSGLWSEFARIIGEVRPGFAFVENSPAIITRGLGRILGDLAALGYDCRAGRCWELPMSERRINGIGFGVWLPTPCTVDTGSMFNRSDSPNAALRPTLGAMAKYSMWPTPTSSLGTKGGRVTPRKSREGGSLIEAVSARQWPTPTVSGKASETTRAKNSRPLSEQLGGLLNPAWVEKLMGWPAGWTGLQPLPIRGKSAGRMASDEQPTESPPASIDSRRSGTGKFPSAPRQHGESLPAMREALHDA